MRKCRFSGNSLAKVLEKINKNAKQIWNLSKFCEKVSKFAEKLCEFRVNFWENVYKFRANFAKIFEQGGGKTEK